MYAHVLSKCIAQSLLSLIARIINVVVSVPVFARNKDGSTLYCSRIQSHKIRLAERLGDESLVRLRETLAVRVEFLRVTLAVRLRVTLPRRVTLDLSRSEAGAT